MIEESFESLEDDDIEEAAQEEVDKILWEVTSGKQIYMRVEEHIYHYMYPAFVGMHKK